MQGEAYFLVLTLYVKRHKNKQANTCDSKRNL